MTELLLKAGAWHEVTPASAGWRHLLFGVREGSLTAETGAVEVALVVLGGRCRVEADGAAVRARRPRVRVRGDAVGAVPAAGHRLPGRGTRRGPGRDLRRALQRRREPVLVRPEEVEIEVRGAGNATRQINHMIKPGFPAERLLVVEVLTPVGQLVELPAAQARRGPAAGEVGLEETYYYRTPTPEAFGVQRLYSPEHGVDVTGGARRRPAAGAVRLPPDHGRARLRPLLPERARRRPALDGRRRRSRRWRGCAAPGPGSSRIRACPLVRA